MLLLLPFSSCFIDNTHTFLHTLLSSKSLSVVVVRVGGVLWVNDLWSGVGSNQALSTANAVLLQNEVLALIIQSHQLFQLLFRCTSV